VPDGDSYVGPGVRPGGNDFSTVWNIRYYTYTAVADGVVTIRFLSGLGGFSFLLSESGPGRGPVGNCTYLNTPVTTSWLSVQAFRGTSQSFFQIPVRVGQQICFAIAGNVKAGSGTNFTFFNEPVEFSYSLPSLPSLTATVPAVPSLFSLILALAIGIYLLKINGKRRS
jgi:hypothetical protein